MIYRVVLRRTRGDRYVKEWPVTSKYRAKKKQDELEEKYDSGYYVEVIPPDPARHTAGSDVDSRE